MYDETIPSALGPRHPYPTLDEPSPRRDVGDLSTYLAQVVVDSRVAPGRHEAIWPRLTLELAPPASEPADARAMTELDLGFSCVSAWHPRGEPHSLWANLALHERLLTRALELDPGARATTVHAADHSWAEQAVILRRRGDALVLAVDFDAPAITTYSGLGAAVVTPDGALIDEAPTTRLTVKERCVMLHAPQPGQLCRMYGGPWISRSIRAAADWADHRALLTNTLGCAVCENGRFTKQPQLDRVSDLGPGGPIVTVERTCASRWGGPFLLGKALDW